AFLLGLPAGVLCTLLWQAGFLGMILMGFTGAWVVSLYMRSQKPAWITLGAGARIGLVTGIIGAWTASATSGIILYALRYWFHQGGLFDNFLTHAVEGQLTGEWKTMGFDAQMIAQEKALLLSPAGHGMWALASISFLMAALLV